MGKTRRNLSVGTHLLANKLRFLLSLFSSKVVGEAKNYVNKTSTLCAKHVQSIFKVFQKTTEC